MYMYIYICIYIICICIYTYTYTYYIIYIYIYTYMICGGRCDWRGTRAAGDATALALLLPNVCHLPLLYYCEMCSCTAVCVSLLTSVYVGPHITVYVSRWGASAGGVMFLWCFLYVSSYYYVSTCYDVSSYCCVSTYYCICVLMLLCMCPHATVYVCWY